MSIQTGENIRMTVNNNLNSKEQYLSKFPLNQHPKSPELNQHHPQQQSIIGLLNTVLLLISSRID